MREHIAPRNHPAYWAFVLHRVSGLMLALFLPVHLWVIGLALENTERLNALLAWSDTVPVKLAEAGLVILLAAHIGGGIRLLAVEFLPWRDRQTTLAALVATIAIACGLLFLLRAF